MANEVISSEKQNEKLSPIRFIKEFFCDYTGFLKRYLTQDKPPCLHIIVWLLGVSIAIGQIESRYLFNNQYPLDNWILLWAIILIAGIVLGILGYYIGGALYHIRVTISDGRKDYQTSSYLYLYSGIPIYIVTIIDQITSTFFYGSRYFTDPTNDWHDYIGLAVALIAIVYSIVLSYKGVKLLQQTKPIRSVIFFIVIPALTYILIMGGVIFKAFTQYSEGIDYNDKAIELMNEGEYEQAERHFNLALEKMSKDDREDIITITRNLILLYTEMGETTRALEKYDDFLVYHDSTNSTYYVCQGEMSLLRGDIFAAVVDFERALEINPNDFDAHNNLGLIFLGEYGEDYEDFVRAVIHNEIARDISENEITIQNLALNYFFLENYDNALTQFEKFDKINPYDASTKFYIGMIYYYDANDSIAELYLRKAMELDSSYIELLDEIMYDIEVGQ